MRIIAVFRSHASPMLRPRLTPRRATHVALVRVTRGDAVDSIHFGSVAVVDREGHVLHAAGDPSLATMTRSALKPFQALPFVAARRRRAFRLLAARRSRCCARATPASRATWRRSPTCWRRGRSPADLQCGAHRAAVLRGARRIAAAAAVFAARSTIARASTPACSPIARQCGLPTADLSRVRPSAAAGDPGVGRALHGRRGGALRRRHRRLLGAQLRGPARPRLRSPSRGSPRRRTIRLRLAPRMLADAMTRASGDGLGREAATTSP